MSWWNFAFGVLAVGSVCCMQHRMTNTADLSKTSGSAELEECFTESYQGLTNCLKERSMDCDTKVP